MQIIPVIDLKGGRVVRAVRGERGSYSPIDSPLVASSAPQDVVAAFSRLFDFPILYVADLDAIEGRPGHGETLAALARAFPQIALWVDDGSVDAVRIAARRAAGVQPVIGSESLPAGEAPRIDADAVLSLDFRGGRFLGPPALLDDARLWPWDVIVMTLARVGSFEGPDIELISRLSRAADGRRLFAAGGVRDAGDLDMLAQAGAAGALVASALHDGRLSPADLRRFSSTLTQ